MTSSVLIFAAAQSAACDSVVIGTGLLQSVNYPDNYTNNYSCSWTLQASHFGGLVHLEFQDFATQSDCDFLKIYDQAGTLIYTLVAVVLPSFPQALAVY